MKLASTPPLGCFSLSSYTQTWGSARSFAAEPRAFSVVSSSKPSSLTELKDIDHKRAGRGPRNDSFAEPLRRDFQEREEGTFSLHPPAPPVSLTGLAGMAAADARPGAAIPVELRRERRMVCVEYPGVVRDVSKMLRTLGGEEGVSRIYADATKRLELYFRPKDPYCHPVCANRFSTNSLLLRIKRKTRRQSGALGPEARPRVTYNIESLGVVSTVFKFQGMSDFQYLAVHTEADGRQTSMYDKVLMLKPQKESFFHQDLPLYIPPPIFSRLDTPVDYYYRPETQHREGYNNPAISGENLIGLSRARRPHNAIFVNFEGDEVPERPMEAAVQTWKKVCTNPVDHRVEEELRKLFDIRPIWSRNALKANISVHPDKLKILLPFVAYYMITGPWRSLWIRFGFDPRKRPEAKIYQVLDFRIRCGMKYVTCGSCRAGQASGQCPSPACGYAPSDMPVKAKRSTYNYSLPITVKKTTSQLVTMHDLKQGLGPSGSASAQKSSPNKYKLKDSVYIFQEGALPPYRQMFYQFCDLNVEELQRIIHRNDGAESSCTERDGWCLPKTTDELRDTMSLMIRQTIRSKRPALFSSPTKADSGKEQLTGESGEDEEEDEEEEEEEFKPSDGSENEMETEILDYV